MSGDGAGPWRTSGAGAGPWRMSGDGAGLWRTSGAGAGPWRFGGNTDAVRPRAGAVTSVPTNFIRRGTLSIVLHSQGTWNYP